MKRYCIRAIGKVHGVGYRISATEKARELGLRGFARNDPDSSVYIEAEGAESALETFADWCAHGPAIANVSRIDIKREETLENYSNFVAL